MIRFDKNRMASVLDAHMRWWEGTLDRPLVSVTLTDAHPAASGGRPPVSQATALDFSLSPEEVIGDLDRALSTQEYLGDAFPLVNFDFFGPGVLAAMCGARADDSTGGIWFFPKKKLPVEEIRIRYDPDCPIAQRIKALYRAGLERWDGNVIMGLPDLGGVMDVAASFRGTEDLLTDLYDAPEEVLRLIGEIETAWYDAYADFSAVLAPQGAISHWSGLLSRASSYIVQCDFSYMIGPEMFRRFVLDTIRRDSARLEHTIYHLDGVGQLKHLPMLLELGKLDAVQWVPGAGRTSPTGWEEVFRAIIRSGKRFMMTGNVQEYLDLLGTLKGEGLPFFRCAMDAGERAYAERLVQA